MENSTLQIKRRWTGAVLFDCKVDASLPFGVRLGAAVKLAVKARAVLTHADLTRADLTDADLTGAVLTGAVLTRADLTDAVLTGAGLTGAVLTGAVLTRADLTDADLTGAVLTDAVLTGAVLTRADLTPIRDDLWAVLSAAPREVEGLRAALAEGRVNGSTYSGECACLVGTLANVRGCDYKALVGLAPNSDRPAERFFMAIREGDTPAKNQAAKIALEWTDTWLANMRNAFGGAP